MDKTSIALAILLLVLFWLWPRDAPRKRDIDHDEGGDWRDHWGERNWRDDG